MGSRKKDRVVKFKVYINIVKTKLKFIMYQHNRTAQPFGAAESNSALNSMNDILSSLSGLPQPTTTTNQAVPKNNSSASSHFYSKNQYQAIQRTLPTTVPPTPPPSKPRYSGPPTAVPSDSDRPQYTTVPYNPYEHLSYNKTQQQQQNVTTNSTK